MKVILNWKFMKFTDKATHSNAHGLETEQKILTKSIICIKIKRVLTNDWMKWIDKYQMDVCHDEWTDQWMNETSEWID